MIASDMHNEVGLLVGSVVAIRAQEGSLSSVNSHVPCQEGREVKPLPAHTADVVPLTSTPG